MRCGFAGDIAMPMCPRIPPGKPPPVTCVHVFPPSVLLYRPLPGPLLGGYTFHGGRRVCQSDAKITFESDGLSVMSIAPVFSSLYRTLLHVLPPSTDLNTPRCALAAY